MRMRTRYRAGSTWHPGTALPDNVTGECPHEHHTAAAAQACIDRLDAAIKRGHGPNAGCDRHVMVEHSTTEARHGRHLLSRSSTCPICSPWIAAEVDG